MSLRVRFAPSPTGFLHIGGARTALFNWLLARRLGGTLVLRIEDTDLERSKPEFEAQILRDLAWLGLDWDEGPIVGGPHEPYRQTERSDHYMPYIQRLLDTGWAYRCDCTTERLDTLREEQSARKEKPRYDGRCRDRGLSADCGRHVVRFRTPTEGSLTVDDMVKGPVTFELAEFDDLVILRSDGSPIYNFVVVIDDLEMEISHVLRGDDHLNNTPKQILMYQALGAPIPRFGHMPLILGPDGSRLSKRHGATSVGSYRDMGILPEAMLNYLARLGWSHGDQEVFSKTDLTEVFDVEGIGKSGGKWDMDKLTWLNQVWLKRVPSAELAALSRPFFEALGLVTDARLEAAVTTLRERSRTLVDLAESGRFYFEADEAMRFDAEAVSKFLKPEIAPALADLAERLSALSTWDQAGLEGAVNALLEQHGLKLGKLAQPVRVAITGQKVGPGVFECLEALGQERAVRRLRSAAIRASA